jgi:hypothetical protein
MARRKRGTVSVNIEVPVGVHSRFKSACALRREPMGRTLIDLMDRSAKRSEQTREREEARR